MCKPCILQVNQPMTIYQQQMLNFPHPTKSHSFNFRGDHASGIREGRFVFSSYGCCFHTTSLVPTRRLTCLQGFRIARSLADLFDRPSSSAGSDESSIKRIHVRMYADLYGHHFCRPSLVGSALCKRSCEGLFRAGDVFNLSDWRICPLAPVLTGNLSSRPSMISTSMIKIDSIYINPIFQSRRF
jgi:hypothetical protein